MASGIIFYWVSWFFWIIVTFFMNKSGLRTTLASFILLLIFCSNIHFTVGHHQISLTFLLLILCTFLAFSRLTRSNYYLFIVFTIMIAYMAILFWEREIPVLVFMPRMILIPIITSFIISILTSQFYIRLTTGILGVSIGELFYNLLISSYHIQANIGVGEFTFLDNLAITILLLASWSLIQKGQQKLINLTVYYKEALKMAR